MRLLADRVGGAGEVLGIDVDGALAEATRFALRGEGYEQCDVVVHDVTEDVPLPRAPFDLVYARLLLFHLPQRVTVLRRLWDAVAPGGHLLVQDYDLRGATVLPALPTLDEGGDRFSGRCPPWTGWGNSSSPACPPPGATSTPAPACRCCSPRPVSGNRTA